MSRLSYGLVFLALATAPACSSTRSTPDAARAEPAEPAMAEPVRAEPAAPATEPADPSPMAASLSYSGKLTYTELPATKSVEAYLGVEFTLTTASGPVVLDSSDNVSHDALIALDGKTIEVQCSPRRPRPPSPDESYPMGPDGQPLARPTKCVVYSVQAK